MADQWRLVIAIDEAKVADVGVCIIFCRQVDPDKHAIASCKVAA